MGWIGGEAVWLPAPRLADGFVGREAFEGLEPSSEVVGADAVREVAAELVVVVVVVALDRGLLDGVVHSFD